MGSKFIQDIGMMEYDRPELVVTTLKEFDVDEPLLAKLKTAGNNPHSVGDDVKSFLTIYN